MDFNSLSAGQPFYILQKGEKPVLQVGVVKTKSDPKSPYNVQQPAILNGLSAMNAQNMVVDMVVTVGTAEIPFNNLPVSAESSTYNGGDTFVSCSREATLQAIDARMQASKKHIEDNAYHVEAIPEYEKMLESLNPAYAESKERDRTIKELVEHRKETDSKLDKILSFMQELTAPTKKGNP